MDNRELLRLIEGLADLVADDHYGCDLSSDHKCDHMDYGDWQIKYQHGLVREAKQAIEVLG